MKVMQLVKLLLVALCSSTISWTFSQSLYDSNTIQTIQIVFAQSNWDALLDAEKQGADGYIMAQTVTINGVAFDSVGVKYKGNSSYNANQTKNPFHIELDTYKNQDYQGYTDIKLSNVKFDPSFVRETVSYSILRKYMHAPEANYANVYVNGTLIGLYTNIESISKKFVDKHFASNNNSFFDCSPPAGAGPQSTNLPNLSYLGTDSASYYSAYDMKSNAGWNDLIQLTSTLASNINSIETVLDVDRAIWMLAFDNVMVNLDSYIGKFKQNYYLYQDDNGRFNPIIWDLNMSFGVFSDNGTTNLTTTTAKAQMTHLLHANDAAWPLVQKLLAVPSYKRKYLAHFKTILEENISNGEYLSTAQDFQTLISSAVSADVNKFYTLAQFNSNISTDVSTGMQNAPGLSNLMTARNSYLTNLSDFTATQPSISAIVLSTNSPVVGTSVSITAEVLNTNTDAVYVAYRTESIVPFIKVPLYDDGQHNDGAAGDNIYGGNFPISTFTTQYYLYAENNSIGRFSPARAEHEFYTVTAAFAELQVGDVVINELVASNASGASDEIGNKGDWLELYNNTSNPIDLIGYSLSDDPSNLQKWSFPPNSVIPANGYLIVWADDAVETGPYHTNWKLSATGETITLSAPSSTIIEQVVYGNQDADIAYARIPNGTGDFVFQLPTFNGNNEWLNVNDVDLENPFTVYPNPTTNTVYINSTSHEIKGVSIYGIDGSKISESTPLSTEFTSVDFSFLPNGVYILKINNVSHRIVKL